MLVGAGGRYVTTLLCVWWFCRQRRKAHYRKEREQGRERRKHFAVRRLLLKWPEGSRNIEGARGFRPEEICGLLRLIDERQSLSVSIACYRRLASSPYQELQESEEAGWAKDFRPGIQKWGTRDHTVHGRRIMPSRVKAKVNSARNKEHETKAHTVRSSRRRIIPPENLQ